MALNECRHAEEVRHVGRQGKRAIIAESNISLTAAQIGLLRVAPGHTDKTACETTANASERPPTYCSAMQEANHWLALASDG